MRTASFNLPASEPSATEESQFNSVLLRERASADRSRRLDTPRWLRSLDTRANARVVQVGANDHRREHGDKVPSLIRQGWQATLYEPVPHLHARLRTRYAGNASVTLRQAAVCPSSCSGDDGARDEPNATVWAVDLASSPHEGSNLSDPRCAAVPGAEFVVQPAAGGGVSLAMGDEAEPRWATRVAHHEARASPLPQGRRRAAAAGKRGIKDEPADVAQHGHGSGQVPAARPPRG